MGTRPTYTWETRVERMTEHAHGAQQSGHFAFVDVLNIIACFAVVLLHTSLNVYSPAPTRQWTFSAVYQSLAIFAVPVFFMISGMNLLGYRERYSTKLFFRKRFWRVGRALIVGSVICYCVYSLFPMSFYGAQAYAESFGAVDFLKRFLTNQANDTYWFFYSIIYLYMLVPLLSKAADDKRCMQYLIALTILCSVALPFMEQLGVPKRYFGTLLGWPLYATIGLLYLLLGYYLHHYVTLSETHRLPWAVVFVISTVAMACLTLWTNHGGNADSYENYYAGITSPLCVVQSVALFMLVRSCESMFKTHGKSTANVIRVLSGGSLGVYLFHILFVNWVGPARISRTVTELGQHPFIKAVVVYASTVLIVVIVKSGIAKAKNEFRAMMRNKEETKER